MTRNLITARDSYPVTISPRFKELLRKEFHSLIEEWNWAPVRRRREIAKICQLIIGIIDGAEEQR